MPPLDNRIFSVETFAFSERNQDAATELLGRPLPNGGGDSLYNLAMTPDHGARLWAEVDGSTIGADAGPTPGFHSDGVGIQVGGDATAGAGARLGLAFGYNSSWLHDTLGGSATQEIYRVSAYGSQTLGPIGLSAVVSYAHASDDTRRPTGVGSAFSSRGTGEWTGALQGSAPFDVAGAKLTPMIGVAISRLGSSSFVESLVGEPAFAISGAGASATFVTPYAALGFSRAFTSASGLTIIPEAQVGYRHDEAAKGGAFALTAADGTAFLGNRADLSQGAALLGAGLTAHRDRWTAFIKYRGELASGWSNQSAIVGVRVAF